MVVEALLDASPRLDASIVSLQEERHRRIRGWEHAAKMGDALSTCAGGEDSKRSNDKFRKPKFSLKTDSYTSSQTARNPTLVTHGNSRKAAASLDNPFQQYEQVKVSKQALMAQKMDAQEEYELVKAKAQQHLGEDGSDAIKSQHLVNQARKKYLIQLFKIKELASINFQYTVVKQIELEIEAVKTVGSKNIVGDEEFLNVPLEVPKVSFELKEMNTPKKEVNKLDNNDSNDDTNNNDSNANVNINTNDETMKTNYEEGNDANKTSNNTIDPVIKKTIKEFSPSKISQESPLPSPPKNQNLSYEERRNQAWEEDIHMRMQKKKEVKSNLQNLLRRQQERNSKHTA